MPLIPRLADDHGSPAELVEVWVAGAELERHAARARSAAVLRDVLARRLGLDGSTLSFDTTCRWCGNRRHGKPRLRAPRTPDVRFSVSRTLGVVVVAVAGVEVGVDVEHNEVERVERLIPFVLAPAERQQLTDAGPHRSARAFLRLWTAKEAYLKGIGLGLCADPTAVTFSEAASGWRAVDDPGCTARWHVTEVHVGDDWVAALALSGDPREVVVRSWPVSP
jgi:4'-phosphopantetheinyl transferase